jgi:prepilin-type N-terminal cleavage/methylation domain-containing protein
MRSREAGVTLIELLVAVTLLSLLSLGMVMALRLSLSAYSKTETKLMESRRVMGAQRIVQQELEGMVPAFVMCGAGQGAPGMRAVLFQGTPAGIWMVSTFSLQMGWRGQPQILQVFVIPGKEGVRLVVNEYPYTGPIGAAQYCSGSFIAPNSISRLALMTGFAAGPQTFVLADNLASVKFSYYTPAVNMYDPPAWQPEWASKGWPMAVRIEMVPSSPALSRLEPITVTAPIHIRRDADKVYTDDY